MTDLEQKIRDVVRLSDGRVSIAIELPSHCIQIGGDRPYSAASLIKIPILLEGFRQSEEGKISLNEQITIPKESRVGGAGVLAALSEEVSLTMEDLFTLMIIVSDNTATNVLVDRLTPEAIQSFCHSLNLKQTKLLRKMLDFDAIKQGFNNYTSALDILSCLKLMDRSPIYSQNSREKMLRILHHQQFTNKLPAKMDRESVFVANKTGELPGVEHDCAIMKIGNKTAYIAVLIDGLGKNSSGKDTIAHIGKLIFDFIISE
ncbi:class A beta-lactamase-related serine hydrolase [Rossellomorea aquimaris]|uniref:serine hydrolase n=1 Tax=Rossellomorea aquimaris TaxID=189382 RepID=UPI001CD79C4A|nr:serine hydrolase [Rossellomorea aquimaris]MCA1058814.1 class A beta-lactamase-related serine hydrolase [Rossellomorea aquimaris]